MGGSLSGIRIKDAARGIAAFEITGDNLDQLDREYRSGQALGRLGVLNYKICLLIEG